MSAALYLRVVKTYCNCSTNNICDRKKPTTHIHNSHVVCDNYSTKSKLRGHTVYIKIVLEESLYKTHGAHITTITL